MIHPGDRVVRTNSKPKTKGTVRRLVSDPYQAGKTLVSVVWDDGKISSLAPASLRVLSSLEQLAEAKAESRISDRARTAWAGMPDTERDLRILIDSKLAMEDADRPLLISTIRTGYYEVSSSNWIAIAVRGTPPHGVLIIEPSSQRARLDHMGRVQTICDGQISDTHQQRWEVIQRFLASSAGSVRLQPPRSS